jgi:hypothetical protein
MGPILIFDKSSLQGLSVDEAVLLDHSYLSVITPLFFIETLADLEKEVRSGRTPEQVVGNLAEKTPDMSGSINTHHEALMRGELLGIGKIDMRTGRPHLSGGRPMELAGKTGVIFETSPEEEAFHRWQEGKFLDVERLAAKAWRQGLANINLEEAYEIFKERLPRWVKPKSLKEVKDEVDSIITNPEQENVFRMALALLNIDEGVQKNALDRWFSEGRPRLDAFAPYFSYIFSVDLFFYLAIAADLIGRGRASHKVDIAYLYYLPFCMVFSSNDNLHKDIVPLFLRDNQTFVPGTELKADLRSLDLHYEKLPDEIKQKGLATFSLYPPDDESFLIARLWDKHMNPEWRKHKKEHDERPRPSSDESKKNPLMDAIREAEKKGAPMKPHIAHGLDDPNHIVIRRQVKARKGKWERFPPEMRNRRKNKDGEWEDAE